MTIYDSTLLDEMEQMEVIWDSVYIGQHEDEVYLYKCYQQNDFYIETKRHKEFDVLHGIRTFKNPELLELYLNLGQ
jgi:hypothetical protein